MISNNKSSIVLAHKPSGIKAEANGHRSQHRNREAALGILKARIAAGTVFPLPLRASYELPDDLPMPDDLESFAKPV